MAALQSEVEALQTSKEANASETQALQAKVQELDSEKSRLEARVRSQVTKFAEWKGQFDGLSLVRAFRSNARSLLCLRSLLKSISAKLLCPSSHP